MTARRSLALAVFSVALLAAASAARAQDATLAFTRTTVTPPSTRASDSSVSALVGPTRDAASLAVRPASEANLTPAPAPARGGFSHGEALMIVGGAAILTGIVVGNNAGHAISVAGAVIGLIGLYQYLQ